MGSEANFYNEQGQLILSKDDLALVNNIAYKTCKTSTNPGDSNFQWNENFNSFQDASTGATNVVGQWMSVNNANAFPGVSVQAPVWFSPGENSNVLMIDKTLNGSYGIMSFGVSSSGNGVKVMPVQRQNLNQFAGYFDVYNEAGNLQWSVQSLIQAPKIVAMAHLTPNMYTKNSMVVVDVAGLVDDPAKCYVLPTNAGRVDYDELFFAYVGILVKRIGTKFYFRGMYKVTSGPVASRPIKDVFGEEGVYIPIAYMPNG